MLSSAAAAGSGSAVVATSRGEYLNPLLRCIAVHRHPVVQRMLQHDTAELHTVSTTFAYKATPMNLPAALCVDEYVRLYLDWRRRCCFNVGVHLMNIEVNLN